MIVDKPVIMEKCQGCKEYFEKQYLTEYMGCMLCGFCLAFQNNADHPEDARRDEWGL